MARRICWLIDCFGTFLVGNYIQFRWELLIVKKDICIILQTHTVSEYHQWTTCNSIIMMSHSHLRGTSGFRECRAVVLRKTNQWDKETSNSSQNYLNQKTTTNLAMQIQ